MLEEIHIFKIWNYSRSECIYFVLGIYTYTILNEDRADKMSSDPGGFMQLTNIYVKKTITISFSRSIGDSWPIGSMFDYVYLVVNGHRVDIRYIIMLPMFSFESIY